MGAPGSFEGAAEPRGAPPPPERATAANGHDTTPDIFDDDQAWGDVGPTDEGLPAPTHFAPARGKPSEVTGGGAGAWPPAANVERGDRGRDRGAPAEQRLRPSGAQERTRAAGELPRKPPTQSKLVQRVFGGRDRRGGGVVARGRGRATGASNRAARGDGGGGARGMPEAGGRGEGAPDDWTMQAELNDKIRELEEEVRRAGC